MKHKKSNNRFNERKYKIFIDLFGKYVQPSIDDTNYTLILNKSIDSMLIIDIK